MKKGKKNRNDFTAIHESSHALISWFYGLTLLAVSIQPGTKEGVEFEGICKAQFADSSRVESVSHHFFTVPRVYQLIAGRCGTDLLCPEIPPSNGHGGDFRTLEKLYSLDKETLAMHQWRRNNPGADAEAFFRRFKKPVEKIIASKRGTRAIKALARVLKKHGQVSGFEAVRIFEKVWGEPRPLWALPAEFHKSITEEGEKCFPDLMREILLYVKILKEKILPLRDDERNTANQNQVLEEISKLLLLIQLNAIGPDKD